MHHIHADRSGGLLRLICTAASVADGIDMLKQHNGNYVLFTIVVFGGRTRIVQSNLCFQLGHQTIDRHRRRLIAISRGSGGGGGCTRPPM